MRRLPPLLRVELIALSALALCAVLFAGFVSLVFLPSNFSSSDPLFGPSALMAIYFFAIGSLPVALYGAPAYLFLRRRNLASWPSVLALSIAPGLGLAFLDKEWTLIAILAGIVVGCITHLGFRRGF